MVLGKLSHDRFTLVLAGSGSPEYEQEVRQIVSQSGLSDRIRFVGFVTGELKDLLLQGSDLFTLTSHSENFGIAVLEALAVGLPVLVTSGVALSSIVQDQQLGYVTALDVREIAQTLNDYFTNSDAAQKMGDRARQFILENYTWDKIAAQLIEVYQSILDHKSLIPLSHN